MRVSSFVPVSPFLRTVIWTVVPAAPLMRATVACRSASLVGSPSTVTMTSPGASPASFAGDPTKTCVICSPSFDFCSAAPMPEYSPLMSSSRACASLGGRYTV